MDRSQQMAVNILVSLLLFIAILYLVGFDKIIHVLLTANIWFFVPALAAYLILNLLMSYRIKVVFAAMGDKLHMAQILPSNLAGLLASDFTPARVGYFFTAFSLSSRFKIKLEKAIAGIFGPQLFDFMIKATSAAILTAIIVSRVGASNIIINIVIIAAAFGAIFSAGLLVFWPPLLAMLSPFESLPLISKIFAFIRGMHEHSASVFSVKWQIVYITVFSWVVKGAEWFFLSRALGIVITGNALYDLLFMMVFQGAITIIQFIPAPTIAGAGASEAAFAIILLPFGVPFETSVTFGFLTRLLMIVVDMFSLPVIVQYLHKHSMEGTLDKLLKMEH